MQAPRIRLANRGRHTGGLQTVQGGLEALVVALRRAAPNEAQNLVRCSRHQARRANPRIARFDDLAGRPDQDIGVPDRCQTMLGGTLDAHRYAVGAEVDWYRALGLGQRKEWVGHQVLRIACRQFAGKRMEQFELLALRVVPDGHW